MSIFDHPDVVPGAPTWRCEQCGTLQAEASRCWACARSPVACGTCRYFRTSVVSELSYCGLDQARTPVDKDEVRTCWKPAPEPVADTGFFDDARLEPSDGAAAAGPQVRALTSRGVAGSVDPRDAGGLEVPTRPSGRLVEAPHVAPGRRVVSEAGRRARLGRIRRLRHGDLD